jgi:hypothetical protein
MIRGQEFHSIIQSIFGDVNGYMQSEQLQVNCPLCQEMEGLSEPDGKFNLEINTYKRNFRCWKCDEPKFSGSLGRLIRQFGTFADYEIYKSYVGSLPLYDFDDFEKEYIPIQLPIEMIPFSQMDISNLEHIEAYNYLILDRKISKELILKYRLGFCITGKYAKRIIIPSYDIKGEVNYFVARTYDPTVKKKKYDNPPSDKDSIIFNEGFINWDSTVYLVEGGFEMLSLPVNAIPMLGKTIGTALFKKLKELKPNVIVLLDPDAYKNCIDLYFILHDIYIGCEERVKIVKLPTNDDLDELRRNYGDDEVIKSLYSARDLITEDYFIKKLVNPYDNNYRGRFSNDSKRTVWKSGSTKTFI